MLVRQADRVVTEAPTAPQPTPVAAPRRRHPVARGFGLVIGWTCAVLAALGLAVHVLDTRHQSLIVLASAAWVFVPLSVVALGLALWRRAWIAVAVAAALVAVQAVVYMPLFVAQTAPSSPAATVKVLTQNMLYGQANAGRIVTRVKSTRVEVFVAQELTTPAVARLRAAGLDELLPYSVLDPRPESAGTGVWSRYPITDGTKLASQGLAGVTGRISVGGVTLGVGTVHPSSPFPGDPGDWYHDLDLIRSVLRAEPAGPMIVGGDFNATSDHARFRRLLVDGWEDGAQQAGVGLVRTWPSNRGIPALVGIDHVLTRGAVTTSVKTVYAPGSDHFGLLATVAVPR